MFDFFEDNPERMSRFKDAMSFLQTFPGLEPSYAVKSYDWASLGKATVVDVGGSHGLVCIALAKEFPNLQFVVQDLPKVVEDARTKSPAELSHRVTFQAHDFFQEQPVKNAEIYYFRWILHDWSDKYCVKILQALIPALKPGARLLFSERCFEAPCTLPLRAERWNRYVPYRIVILTSYRLCEYH
jgi:SAM-dependent methyltransferase